MATMLICIFIAHQRPVWANGISLHLFIKMTIINLVPFLSLFPSNVWQLLFHISHSLILNTKNAVDKRPSLYQQYNWNPVIATLHRLQHLLGFSIHFTTQTPGIIIKQTKSTHRVKILLNRHSNLRDF